MGISDVIAWVSRLVTVAKKANQLELEEQLVKVRAELVGIQNELTDKGQLIMRLREAAKLRPRVALNFSAYWEWDANSGEYGLHPYCTRCFDVDGLAVHLQEKPLDDNERSSYGCPQCGQSVRVGHWFRPPDNDPDGNLAKSK